MINSLRMRAEITYKSGQTAAEALDAWQQTLESLINPGGVSFIECFMLRNMKILPCRGEIIKPHLVGSKLILDITVPAIFFRGRWETVSHILGDLVPDVAAFRGLSGKSYPVPTRLAAIEVKMEMWLNLLKLGEAQPLYYRHITKILR